jgi:glycosyltransferase involved in cell wall biosynthesis
MNPALSVVIAAYNHGRYLGSAIQSALNQTWRDLEVIVVDDGSTDETPSVVQSYLADPRLRYCRTEHQGVARAKNGGIRLARAPFLAFLDADDVWLPRKVERQLTRFRSEPSLGVVYSRRLLMDEAGQPLEYEQPPLPRGDVLAAMFRANFVCFSSAVVRRDILDVVGSFDEGLELAIDYDLWLRVAMFCRFDFVDEPLVLYRTGHASLSRRGEERLLVVLRVMRRFLDELGGRDLLGRRVIRTAWAETCYHLGLATAARSRLAALPWYVRCLVRSPGYAPAWKGLASLPLPEVVRRGLRRALGRPADWSRRRPVEQMVTG